MVRSVALSSQTLLSRSPVAQPAERQMAAVVAADIAGYSRLMGADEEGTLARLKACRRDLIDPGIARHRGRIVKTTGDGLLLEFSSPVEAVRWAVEMQQGMIDRDRDVSDDKRIRFRVGINLGDVIVDDKDLYGDAVNIAARLENLADPGGICISRTVRDQIRDRLPVPFENAGEQSVKNIARPIRVYALSADAVATLPKAEIPEAPWPVRQRYRRRDIAAVTLAVMLLLAGGVWWLWPLLRAPPEVTTASAPAPTAPLKVPRLSIVVLPFANLSDDRDQQYFADGITEDLTTDLSNIAEMFVISRNSAFTYKGKSVDAKQVGRELGVRYVLEGSVRRSGNQVRINAELIDAETNAHLWAERFDRDAGDLFALQSEITGRIANTLNLTLIRAEADRPTQHPDVLDYVLQGRAILNNPSAPQTDAEGIRLYELALDLDPHSVEAQSRLAITLLARVLNRMTETRTADIARAEALIAQALAASPQYPLAHFAKGQLLRLQNRCPEAVHEYETALEANRNWAQAIAYIGTCKINSGLFEEAIALQQQAMRLSPRDPATWLFLFQIGQAHLLQSRSGEAIVWLERSRSANPAFTPVHAWLASAYGLSGDLDRAVAELAEARRLGGDAFSNIARQKAATTSRRILAPAVLSFFEATYLAGLRKAGMPEE
jgi:adenylate cyclase